MNQAQVIEQVKEVKSHHEKQLMALANVVGTGIGFKQIKGIPTDQISLVVNVEHKKPLDELEQQDVVPPEIDGVITDVQEAGRFSAF
jgi:hypothetical protein